MKRQHPQEFTHWKVKQHLATEQFAVVFSWDPLFIEIGKNWLSRLA